MARRSRKKQADTSAATKIYSVGIYARLSVDADERKNESAGTQIEIAKEYVKRQKDMVIRECYTDIGKTGSRSLCSYRLFPLRCRFCTEFYHFLIIVAYLYDAFLVQL